jgi:hypothetical protein
MLKTKFNIDCKPQKRGWDVHTLLNWYILFIVISPILLDRKSGDNATHSVDYKKNQHLSPFQFEALIGLLLGDVFAERNKPTLR